MVGIYFRQREHLDLLRKLMVSGVILLRVEDFSGNTTAYYYHWAGQVEAGEFATSHIPTNGEAATRGADVVDIDGEDFTDFYNQK